MSCGSDRGKAGRKLTFALAAALGAAGALLVVSTASATHARPKAATPLKVSLVPAYRRCTSTEPGSGQPSPANRMHGPPLEFPSCNPPVQMSNYLTVGTPDANGAAANSIGSLTMKAQPDPADLLITLNVTDVRCRPAGPPNFCSAANASGGLDYSGEISVQGALTITDHWNSTTQFPSPTDPYDQPGTASTGWGPVVGSCASTASTSIGATCSMNTSGNAIAPGFSPAVGGKRFLMEVAQLQVFDGGPDGLYGGPAGSDTLFGVQGVFVP